jgi:hypothetical protein
MREDGYYWCLKHQRVESGDGMCRAKHRLGPYETVSDAEHAVQRVQERNEEWEEEDRRWHRERD